MPSKLADLAEPINGLWYGDGKTGKTTAIATMANLGPVVAINAESGIKARALKKEINPLIGHGVKVANISVFPGDGEELTYEGLEALWLDLREQLNKKPDAIVGVFMDSITEMQQALKDISREEAIKRADRAGRSRGQFVVDQDNWREVNEQCRSLIRKFRDLPCHFAVSALERREQDKDGTVTYQPAVTPGLQNDLIGWMDVVCCTSVGYLAGEEEYRGLFRPVKNRRGGDRFKILPPYLIDPTFERVLEYYDGLEVSKDPIMKAAEVRKAKDADADSGDTE